MKKFVRWKILNMICLGMCVLTGFLEDDKESIDAIKEVASQQGSGHFLWKLVVITLLSGTINRHAHVWNKAWLLLSDGILHTQREVAHNTGMTCFFICGYC